MFSSEYSPLSLYQCKHLRVVYRLDANKRFYIILFDVASGFVRLRDSYTPAHNIIYISWRCLSGDKHSVGKHAAHTIFPGFIISRTGTAFPSMIAATNLTRIRCPLSTLAARHKLAYTLYGTSTSVADDTEKVMPMVSHLGILKVAFQYRPSRKHRMWSRQGAGRLKTELHPTFEGPRPADNSHQPKLYFDK